MVTFSLITRLSNGQSGEKCKLLASVARAPLAGQRQHLFLYFLPEIDKDTMRLLFPYTLDALDVYAIDEDTEDNSSSFTWLA